MTKNTSLKRVRLISDDGVYSGEAQEFLDLLGIEGSCTFQTFDDNAERKNPKLACIRHGTLDEHAAELEHLNKLGAGVFVALNETDGRGRKEENITRVRAVTADLDGAPLDPVQRFASKPHVIVQSSEGRYHAYWLVDGLALNQFTGVQLAIAKTFDGDSGIAKLTHCARLPGFFHCKSQPFRSHVLEANNLPPYTADQIVETFPPENKPYKPAKSLAGRPQLQANDPLTCARAFINAMFRTADGTSTLQHFRGSFYTWNGTHFVEADPNDICSKLYDFLDNAVTTTNGTTTRFKPTKAKIAMILDALQMGVLQPRDKQPPFWLEPYDQNGKPLNLIACRNGMLNVVTRELSPHTPYLFNVNCLPFDYDPHARPYPPNWQAFLRQLFPGDTDGKMARLCLQEIFGLMVSGETYFQKIFMIVGPPRSGKGTIARMLTKLLGKENVTAPTLGSLSNQFGLSPLIDKRVAIISDARLGQQTNVHTVAERLLSISGEDALTIDRKYRDPWTGQLGVQFLILTNEMPRIADAAGALATRFVVLTLTESFLGREDPKLIEKLEPELPGILNWALEGLEYLTERGHFDPPQSSKDAIQQLQDLSSPTHAFIRDWCAVGRDHRINVKTLYSAYAKWCELDGHRKSPSIVFGRNLRAVLPIITTSGSGKRREYVGLDLSDEGERAWQAAEDPRFEMAEERKNRMRK